MTAAPPANLANEIGTSSGPATPARVGLGAPGNAVPGKGIAGFGGEHETGTAGLAGRGESFRSRWKSMLNEMEAAREAEDGSGADSRAAADVQAKGPMAVKGAPSSLEGSAAARGKQQAPAADHPLKTDPAQAAPGRELPSAQAGVKANGKTEGTSQQDASRTGRAAESSHRKTERKEKTASDLEASTSAASAVQVSAAAMNSPAPVEAPVRADGFATSAPMDEAGADTTRAAAGSNKATMFHSAGSPQDGRKPHGKRTPTPQEELIAKDGAMPMGEAMPNEIGPEDKAQAEVQSAARGNAGGESLPARAGAEGPAKLPAHPAIPDSRSQAEQGLSAENAPASSDLRSPVPAQGDSSVPPQAVSAMHASSGLRTASDPGQMPHSAESGVKAGSIQQQNAGAATDRAPAGDQQSVAAASGPVENGASAAASTGPPAPRLRTSDLADRGNGRGTDRGIDHGTAHNPALAAHALAPQPGSADTGTPVAHVLADGNRGTGAPETGSRLAGGMGSPARPDAFAALDAHPGHSEPTWVQAGAQRAEAGFNDPSLGWIGVRANLAGGAVHASVLPGSADAAQALGGHLAGLNAHLAEHHIPVNSLHMATPLRHDLGSGQGGLGQGNAHQQGQGNGQQPWAGNPGEAQRLSSPGSGFAERTATAERGSMTASGSVMTAGRHVSVIV